MYILDTDHLSLIQRNGQEGKRILSRLADVVDIQVAVTVITYEEQVKGRLAAIAIGSFALVNGSAQARCTIINNPGGSVTVPPCALPPQPTPTPTTPLPVVNPTATPSAAPKG